MDDIRNNMKYLRILLKNATFYRSCLWIINLSDKPIFVILLLFNELVNVNGTTYKNS